MPAMNNGNGARPPLSSSSNKNAAAGESQAEGRIHDVDPASSTDPSFSVPVLRGRIERLLHVRQIRRSTMACDDDCAGGRGADDDDNDDDDDGRNGTIGRSSFRIALCATIVDEFPHEELWRKLMEETGGEFSVTEEEEEKAPSKTAINGIDSSVAKSSVDDVGREEGGGGGGGKCDGKDEIRHVGRSGDGIITASAEMYVHAKIPERIGSEWLR